MMNLEQFHRMVKLEIENSANKNDSVGTPIHVWDYGEDRHEFLLAPVIRNGKLVAVYKDDHKRGAVSKIASEEHLKNYKIDLFTISGARNFLQSRGIEGSDPIAVSFGPFSFFGALETGWYVQQDDSFTLLSLEGRIIPESDVAKFAPKSLPLVRQAKAKVAPKE
jgi:hypothetical protein